MSEKVINVIGSDRCKNPVICGVWLQEKLKLVTVLGAGLLVGTALAVIIPEGVHTMYSSAQGMVGPPIYHFRIMEMGGGGHSMSNH